MSIVKLNNRSVKDITAFGSITSLGSLTHIATQTASSSAYIDFTSGIDSTYKEYIFYFINIHAGTGDAIFSFPSSEVPRIVETPLGPIQSNCVVPFFQFIITVFVFIFYFVERTITNSPLGLFFSKWSITCNNVPLIVSSNFFEISLETLT